MIRLQDVASVLRSKNAGAFVLTIDVIFAHQEDYDRIVGGDLLSPDQIAAAYRVPVADVSITPYPQVRSIKITLPRRVGSGDLSDSDVYGAQQHVPLMLMQLPDPARAAANHSSTESQPR